MGILDNFEKGLERAVNGAFAKTFKSGLQPVEITSALRRELDTNAAIVSRDRILVPNEFVVRMSSNDFVRMSKLGPTLIDELTTLITKHATKQGYQFTGGIVISLAGDQQLSDGMLEIDSSSVKGRVEWSPVLDIGSTRYPITSPRTVIGRGSEADITVDDTGISRKHVEILWDGSRAQVNDLGSTNGSKLDGQPVSTAPLSSDQVISIGRTRIVYRLIAQSSNQSGNTARNAPRGGGSGSAAPHGPSTPRNTSRAQRPSSSHDPQGSSGAFWDDRL